MDDKLIAFHYADRAKAFIIEAFRILEFYLKLGKSKELDKLMLEVLRGCEREIKLGKRVCSKIDWAKDYFEEASTLTEKLITDFNKGNHEQVKENLRDILNRMTTCAAMAEQKIT